MKQASGRRGTTEFQADVIDALAGPALVLDGALRIRMVSRAAERLVGIPLPVGAEASAVLCVAGPKRPLADALAAGRPVDALIPRRRGKGMLRVHAVPLGDGIGYVLMLADGGAAAVDGPVLFHGMWTQDARMKELFRIIERAAVDDDAVLVRGETGAGKELVATAIHALSSRRKGPLRAINCAALPASLLESELFGHAKGAFTGAHRDAPGHLQLAHRGTLFLDEVGELPLELQAKLLRVLETKTVLPVGARQPIAVDARIVTATHRALRKEVEAGRFRADLMYRLRVIPIYLPPLRDRPGDVSLLVERFLSTMNEGRRRRIERVAPASLRVLERHLWPGNVRELRNALAYAYAIGEGPVLLPRDLPPELLEEKVEPPGVGVVGLSDAARSLEKERIMAALAAAHGRRGDAAKQLGMSRITLWRRMRDHGLLVGDER